MSECYRYRHFGDDDFCHDWIWYVRDFYSGRYYRMEDSVNLRRYAKGGMVKRRVSAGHYRKMLAETKVAIEERESRPRKVNGKGVA